MTKYLVQRMIATAVGRGRKEAVAGQSFSKLGRIVGQIMSDTPAPNKQPAVETDPRFPSGPWIGFWIQDGWGKQQMSLSLAFVDGGVTGSGRDIIGRFDFKGSYDLKTGRVQMVKNYEKTDRVAYNGANQGDGMWLWGMWNIGTRYRGGWHLWPEGEADPTQRRLAAGKELPQSRRLKPGELVEIAAP
jgi:hypothetical protein